MKVESRNKILNLDDKVYALISKDVEYALKSIVTSENKFIINPTIWKTYGTAGKLSATVMNHAEFLSKKFQNGLEALGWEIEKSILNQRFDAYKEFSTDTGYYFKGKDKSFFQILLISSELDSLPVGDFLINKMAYYEKMFLQRKCFNISEVPKSISKHLSKIQKETLVRVGLEFETGNIASSFRALEKLNTLYIKREIDVGVFITSNNKNDTSTKIWPASNRNGSFEELENREYKNNIELPLLEFSFAPDGLSNEMDYLGKNGELYKPEPTGKEKTFNKEKLKEYKLQNSKKIYTVIENQTNFEL